MHLEFTGLGRGASNENHEIILLNHYDRRGQYFYSTHSNKIIKTARTKAYLSVSVFSLESSHFHKLKNLVENPHPGRNSEEFCASGSHGPITEE